MSFTIRRSLGAKAGADLYRREEAGGCAERWDNATHEECIEWVLLARVAPALANYPWQQIASEHKTKLEKVMKGNQV